MAPCAARRRGRRTRVFEGAGHLRDRQANPAGEESVKMIVECDVDGNKTVDFQIELTKLKTLVAADFIL